MPYQPFDPESTSPQLHLPPGSVDTHMHIFGPQTQYAYTDQRSYTPSDALLADYRRMAAAVGIERSVVVQPSVYGTDNRATRDTIRALGTDKARGVAVVDASVSDEELTALHGEGFCGIRVNLLFKGGVEADIINRLAARVAPMGWHIQYLIDVSEFDDVYERLSGLPTEAVIDHMGHMPTHKGLNHPGFTSLLKLVESGRCWVKLSGAYRITGEQHAPYTDVTPFARALVRANPQRMLWGSDWPHPHIPTPMPNDGALVDMLADWVEDKANLQRIMVDNPQELYGFERV